MPGRLVRGCQLVTVNDLLEVENTEWHDLDVVRWQVLEIDLTGVTEEAVVLSRVTKSMASAVSEAEGRLVAARVVFTGATPLHGSLHRESHRSRHRSARPCPRSGRGGHLD